MLVLPVQIHLSQHSQFGGSGDQSTLAVELIRAEARGNAVNLCIEQKCDARTAHGDFINSDFHVWILQQIRCHFKNVSSL